MLPGSDIHNRVYVHPLKNDATNNNNNKLYLNIGLQSVYPVSRVYTAFYKPI